MTEYTLSHRLLAGDLPGLTVARAGLPPEAPLVAVLHGLGSRKEKMLPGLYALAERGLRAIAIDVRLHGERPGADIREDRLNADYFEATTEMVLETARDLSRLLGEFPNAPAGLHGISLGGYVAYAALLLEPRWAAASVALGSPDWLAPMRMLGLEAGHPAYDAAAAMNPLELAPSLLPPRPLLLLHGAADPMISVTGTIALEERLRPAYAAFPERLALHVYPELGHQYTDEMQTRTVDWMTRFL